MSFYEQTVEVDPLMMESFSDGVFYSEDFLQSDPSSVQDGVSFLPVSSDDQDMSSSPSHDEYDSVHDMNATSSVPSSSESASDSSNNSSPLNNTEDTVSPTGSSPDDENEQDETSGVAEDASYEYSEETELSHPRVVPKKRVCRRSEQGKSGRCRYYRRRIQGNG